MLLPIWHALNDCVGGFLIASYHSEYSAWALLLFNVAGFGLQLPFGYLTDRYFSPVQVLRTALFLSLLALFVFPYLPFASLIICGLASGLFHVSAGSLVLKSSDTKSSTWLGAFTAPGVVGLALGGYAGHYGWSWLWPLMGLSAVSILLSLFLKPPLVVSSETKSTAMDKHDLAMILVILVIAFRSATWNVYQMMYENDLQGLLYLAMAAAFGKFAGGWISSRIPTKLYCLVSSFLSSILLAWGDSLFATLSGIFLLQSVTPLVFRSMHQLMPEKTATSSGLVLGLAIALGGLSNLMIPNSYTILGFGVLCLLLYSLIPRRPISLS